MPTIHEVFTPNDTPTHTYVDRSHLNLEQKLRDALSTNNMVVSLSGPSKSGKTVLVKKVISDDQIIPVSGASVKEAHQLWEHALQWMGTPAVVTTASQRSGSVQLTGKGGGSAGVPLVAQTTFETGANATVGLQSTVTVTDRSIAFQNIIREIGSSDFVIFVDDYHYIERGIQVELGRQIKALAESKVKICVASVPHRVDDVLRSNPELSGRIAAVKVDYWADDDLRVIAQKGFKTLSIDLANNVVERLAKNAFGIPQLMQSLCLNLCLELGVRDTLSEQRRFEVSDDVISRTLERTSDFTDYSSVVQGLHSGPKERGTERKQFHLSDGTMGDVYRCVLLALRQDPPETSFTYDDIMMRIKQVSVSDSPVGSSVTNALEQMQILSNTLSPNVPLIDWNENVLSVVEPYFLFFLRASRKLERIRKK